MNLEPYGHGGDWQTAREMAGDEGEWVDFSANLNPLGPPPAVEEILRQGLSLVSRYPDPAARRFRRVWAERRRLPVEAIWVSNGGAEGLQLILRGLKPRRVWVIWPSFGEYEQLSRAEGIPVCGLPTAASEQFSPQLEGLFSRIREGDLLILGSPNNPTSWQVAPEELLRLLDELASRGAWLVVDEAFLDFSPHESDLTMMPLAVAHPRLLVVRSMTKMFAVPGLRLGYVVAHPEVVDHIRRVQVPWSVNALALAVGEQLLREDAFVQQTRRWLQEERERLIRQLGACGVFTLFTGNALTNFVLLRFHGPSASPLQQQLLRQGIVIRNCHTFRGLDGSFLRLAVRSTRENEQLLQSLRHMARGG